MLLSAFVSEASEQLSGIYPKEEARSIVLMLCSSLLGTKSYTHVIEPQYEVPSGEEARLADAMARLRTGEPIQYVLGEAFFHGLRFRVTPDVLIPRPETEMLVDFVVEAIAGEFRTRSWAGGDLPVRVLDLCTGSGCIAWSVALSVPGVEVVGVDISEKALQVAESQDFRRELEASGARKPEFVCVDVLDTVGFPDLGCFDVIVSNPPYVMEREKRDMRSNVLDFEPGLALFVPDSNPLLFYKKIAEIGRKRLSPGGAGFVEINEALGSLTQQVFTSAGYKDVSVCADFFGKDRFLSFR